MTITSQQILSEFLERARTANLTIQCPGNGNPLATIAIVAEAPGEREVAMRMPQVGSGGRLLWETLRKYNIHRSDVWTTNVVKHRLLNDDDSKTQVSSNEFEHWKALLAWELRQLPNLKYIICLGGLALNALTGHQGILKHRGSVYSWEGKPVIVGVNPALPIREPKWEIVFRFDMHKLSRVLNGTHKPREIVAHINPTVDEALAWLDHVENSRDPVAYDIETHAEETACVGFATSTTEGMCINFRALNENTYSLQDELRVRQRMATVFANPNIRWVAQNGVFDMSWLWFKDRIHVVHPWFDTLLGHHTLYPQLQHTLDFLTSQYTDSNY